MSKAGKMWIVALFALFGMGQGVWAQDCMEANYGPTETEMEAKLAQTHKGDPCAIALEQGRYYLRSAQFMRVGNGWPDLKPDNPKTILCFLGKAKARLQRAKQVCTNPSVEFTIRNKEYFSLGSALSAVTQWQTEMQAREKLFDLAAEGNKAYYRHKKDGNLKAYQQVSERVIRDIALFSKSAECRAYADCPKAAQSFGGDLTRKIYAAGGYLSYGMSRAEYEAGQARKAAAKKEKVEKSAAFQKKQQNAQVVMNSAFGRLPMVKHWLEKGTDPNFTLAEFENHKSALMLAAMKGHRDIVVLLLEHGADKTMKDPSGKTALDYCRQSDKCGSDIEALLK